MAKNNLIELFCFGHEIGKLGFDENQNKSFFQYNPAFLKEGQFANLFPLIFKRIKPTQVFSQFNTDTFKGLPPMIADSLPDVFGNIIFKAWLKSKGIDKITVLEQLAYVSNRGMGAIEYRPALSVPNNSTINIDEVVEVLKVVMDKKSSTQAEALNNTSLVNIFKMGSSAGGAQPKILISEHKKTGKIIPGDIAVSNQYHHQLVKLNLDDELGYNKSLIEYVYYQTATDLGITMMPCKLIDDLHFATERFDRQDGKKIHSLTATGLTGWDFTNPMVSSYENLFDLAHFLKIPYSEINELYKRMVFNVVFANADDHLKNHSFTYDEAKNEWHLSAAYDITYSLNPLLTYKKSSRALSINSKRTDILVEDLFAIATKNTIKNPKGIIKDCTDYIAIWEVHAQKVGLSQRVIDGIKLDFWKGGKEL